MAKRKSQTDAELMAELNADSGFVARQREREQARLNADAEDRLVEAPVIDALGKAGIRVERIWQVVGKPEFYPQAVPVLLEQLERPYLDWVREWIARGLAVPEAIEGWETLLRLFEADPDSAALGSKWAIGCALGAAATDDVIDDVIRLAKDPRHGENRSALFGALERSADPRARETLIELSTDPATEYEAKKSLKRLDRKKSGAAKRGKSATKKPPDDLSEASMNFDSNLVEPFLQQLSTLVSGFGAAEIAEVAQMIDELEVDDERELRFEVDHDERRVTLRVRVFMDDVDAPDLHFFTTTKFAAEIDELMKSFTVEHGL